MKLYYKPSACSLASHILLREVGAEFDLEKVDTESGLTESGTSFRAINPRGQVPALEIGEEGVLTEGAAILQYIGDRHPEAGLSPALGSLQRARLQQWLNFLASELHTAFRPFFHADYGEEDRRRAQRDIGRALDTLEVQLAHGDYLTGPAFSAADAYLFVMARWLPHTGVELTGRPRIAALIDRVAARSAVQAALAAEAKGQAA